MTDGGTAAFGALLRRHRTAAALTQERLAELAGLSVTGIAALEAGRRRAPRLSTVQLLVDALGLEGADRDALLAAATGASAPEPVPPRQRPAPVVSRRFAFVGRPAELAELEEVWERRTRVVLVFGEAGVGKTRLAGELATRLHERGATVLWGRCTQESLGAYEPFVEPVRAALSPGEATEVRAELVRLVPELGREGLVPTSTEPGVERRLLFEAVAGLLAGLGPTLLVLDDVQWADAGSLALLAHLAAAPALSDLVVLGTVRSTELQPGTAGALADLRRWSTTARVDLRGLDGADVARLVALVAGTDPSGDLVDTVADATDGNPLFIEELTEHLLDVGWAGGDKPATLVPEGVRATVVSRLATLSPDAQALLRAGAVFGRAFDATVAGRLVDLEGAALVAATEDALLSTLVAEDDGGALSFSHALVQAAVYDAMSTVRRVELHRRAALGLEVVDVDDRSIFDIAHHWAVVAAADPHAASLAATWAVRAGDAAAASADTDEAIERYQRAAELWATQTAEHGDTLVRLGSALSASGRRSEADDRFRAALAIADAVDDARLYARAALGLAATLVYGQSDPERIGALESAVERLGPDERVLRPAAQAMLMRQLGFDPSADSYARRQLAAAGVLEAVSRPDVSDDLLLALGSSRDSIPVDQPIALGQLTRRIVAVASARRDLRALANGWYGQAWSTLELGDVDGWREATAGYRAVAEEVQLPYELALASTMDATTALIEGRYDESERLADVALELSATIGDENAGAVHLTGAVMRGIDLGQAREMVEVMVAARDELADVPTFMAGLAMTAAEAGELALAGELLDDQARVGFDSIRRDAEWLPVLGFLAHAAVIVADRAHVDAIHALLATTEARTVRVGPLAGWWGPVDHHLGAMCRVLGRHDRAVEHLEVALAVEERFGARPWMARTQLELAALSG